jgi:hypothetical protein
MTNTTQRPLMTLAERIASRIAARANCERSGNSEWFQRHGEALEELRAQLPSGSGFDSGTIIDLGKSTAEKIVLQTSFHHMNEYGTYDGWTDHTVTVRASLISGIDLTVSGRNRNGIKEYIHEIFHHVLQVQP